MDDLEREQRASRIINVTVGVAVIAAAVTVALLLAFRPSDETSSATPVAERKAQADRAAAQRQVERQRQARERAVRQKARDRRRVREIEKTWNTVWGDNATRVVVNGGRVTITAVDDGGEVSMIQSLCSATLQDHRWLTRLRVQSGAAVVVFSAVRGDSECSAGDIPSDRTPAAKPAPIPEPEAAPSGDELAIQSFNSYVRRAAPNAPWDYVLDDVYMTGMLTSTITIEVNDESVGAIMCRAATSWMENTDHRFASKAKIYTAVSMGRNELAEC